LAALQRLSRIREGQNMTEEDFAYLRNINTVPGPNAGRSIDSAKPGPTADRIEELKRKIAEMEAANASAPAWGAGVGARQEWVKELRAELSRLRNEQPWCEHSNCPPHECDACSPSPDTSPPQDVRNVLERIAREANDLANGAKFDGNKRTEGEFRRLGKIALAALRARAADRSGG
jgi:hypothetical protein